MRYRFLITLFLVLFATSAFAQVPGTIPQIYGQTYGDNAYVRFGADSNGQVGYNTTQTPDALFFGTSADSNNLVIGEKTDVAYDFAHALSTNPTLFVQSHNQSATQWISFSHDGTNGVIDVGTGKVTFPDGITGAITGNADTATALAANPTDCSSGQFATTIAASGNLTCSDLTSQATITATKPNTAGGSADSMDITATLGIMDGSDTYNGLGVTLTNANHTSTGNVVNGIKISNITGDPDATETGLLIGTGWDNGIESLSTIKASAGIDMTGQNIAGAQNVIANGTVTGGNFVTTTNGTLLLEGSSNDANDLTITTVNPTGSRTATFPDATINVSGATGTQCGTTSTCAATVVSSSQKIVSGQVALVSGTPSTVTVASIPAFTSTTSYACNVTNMTNQANSALKVVNTSTTSITITGPNTLTDTIAYICVGN